MLLYKLEADVKADVIYLMDPEQRLLNRLLHLVMNSLWTGAGWSRMLLVCICHYGDALILSPLGLPVRGIGCQRYNVS